MLSSKVLATGLVVAIALCGCGGQQAETYGFGGLTITSINTTFTCAGGTPFIITGSDFSNVVGAECTVRFVATGGAPFNGSATAEVRGQITSPTTITGLSPAVQICGPAVITATVTVILDSGASGTSAAGLVNMVGPTLTAFGGGNAFPAAIPTAYTINGTGFGPVGDTAIVTWTATNPIFSGGASLTIQTFATITASTLLSGVSPEALVCGPAFESAAVTHVEFPGGCCTPPGTNLPCTFTAPRITVPLTNNGVAPYAATSLFAAAIPEPFTVTGSGFGPVGGTATIRWTSATATLIYSGATSSTTTVNGTILSSTMIAAVEHPAAAVCTVASDLQNILVTMPGGSCSPAAIDGLGAATQIAPTLTQIDNLDRGIGTTSGTTHPAPNGTGYFYGHLPETFQLTGTDFGPIGGTGLVTITYVPQVGVVPTTPFLGETSATQVVLATITSRTTLEGLLPAMRMTLAPRPPLIGGVGHLRPAADLTFDALLEGGSCNPALLNPGGLEVTGPVLAPGLGLVLGGPPTDVVSTIRLGETEADSFTLTGQGFGPAGVCAVIFEDTVAPTTMFNGASSTTVVGTVVNDTTITGRLPLITAPRLSIDQTARVVVQLSDGSEAYTDNDANFVAPPTVTSITTTRAPFDQSNPVNLLADTWLVCMGTDTTITGTGFDPLVTDLWYDTLLGPATPIGAGLLGTIPEPTATAPGVGTPRTVTTPTTINGASPVDLSLAEATGATCRLVNPDMQFHEQSGLTFETTGVLPNVNAGTLPGNNAEMCMAVNPTNPLNACVCAHDLRMINGQFSNQMYHAYTLDGGVTWTQFPIGPNTTAAWDGIGPAPRNSRFDPMCAFDAFGNYYAIYFTDDGGAPATRICVAQQSSDGGASFTNVRWMAFPAGARLDRETVATGPDAAVAGNQVVYVGIEDLLTQAQMVAGFTVPGLGALGVDYPAVTVNDLGPLPGFGLAHCTPSVGPNGELYVTWVQAISAMVVPTVPQTQVYVDVDLDGLGGGAFGFGIDRLVALTDNAARRLQTGQFLPQPTRGKGIIPVHQVIPTGPNAGRIVLVWTDMLTGGPNLDTTVVSQYSDDNAFTWSLPKPVHGLQSGFQYQPWIGADPVRGDVYVGYYDTRNDVTNRAVEWMLTASEDGVTWTASFLVAQAASRAGLAGGNDMLEYNGVAVYDGCVWTCWADNANFPTAGANANGTLAPDGFDVVTSVVALDPDDN